MYFSTDSFTETRTKMQPPAVRAGDRTTDPPIIGRPALRPKPINKVASSPFSLSFQEQFSEIWSVKRSAAAWRHVVCSVWKSPVGWKIPPLLPERPVKFMHRTRKQLRGEMFTSLVWNLSSSPSLFPSLLWQEAEASERFSRLPEDVTIPASISSRVGRVRSGNFPRTARLPVRRGSDDYLLPVGFLCTPHQVKLLLKPPSLSPAAPRGGGRGLGDAATSNLWMF